MKSAAASFRMVLTEEWCILVNASCMVTRMVRKDFRYRNSCLRFREPSSSSSNRQNASDSFLLLEPAARREKPVENSLNGTSSLFGPPYA